MRLFFEHFAQNEGEFVIFHDFQSNTLITVFETAHRIGPPT